MRIFAYRSGALGDSILILPTLQALKSADPGSHVTLVGTPSTASFLSGRSAVDAWISSDLASWARYFVPGEADDLPPLPGSFDLAVVWSSDAVFAANLRNQIPMVRSASPIPRPGAGSASIQASSVLTKEERFFFNPNPRITPTNVDTMQAKEFLHTLTGGRNKSRPSLAIHAGAGSPEKRWPLESFRQAAQWWVRAGGIVFSIVGSAEEDIPLIGSPDDGIFSIQSSGLPLIAGVLQTSDAFLGNDSGITHLADAVGTHGVVCFGPTDPAVWAPQSERIVVFRKTGGHDSRPDAPADHVISELSRMMKTTATNSGEHE